jgi:hypothetical protein
VIDGVTTWPKRKTFRYLYINRELKVSPVFRVKDRDQSNKEKIDHGSIRSKSRRKL